MNANSTEATIVNLGKIESYSNNIFELLNDLPQINGGVHEGSFVLNPSKVEFFCYLLTEIESTSKVEQQKLSP